MKRRLVLNLSEDIHEYVGNLPFESWGHDSETMEYGSPDEIAMSAAYTYFGELHDTMVDDPEALMEEETGSKCQYNEPHEQMYYNVLHSLNANAGILRQVGLTYLDDVHFKFPYLVLDLSNEMDMSKYRDREEPPRH